MDLARIRGEWPESAVETSPPRLRSPGRPAAAPTAPAGIRVEVLGPLRAFAGGREIELGAPKQRAAFAVLALCANTVIPRDELIDRIWGESIPTTAAGSLHTYVSGLRRALAGLCDPGPLSGGSDGYSLRLHPDGLDSTRAQQLSARARSAREAGDPDAAIDALDEALSLWHAGPPLGALPGPFAAQQRARLSAMRLRVLVDRAELLVDAGRSADLAEAAAQLEIEACAHPFDERLHSVLMLALHHSGRTADALGHYLALRRSLAEELGIEPEASTQAVHMAILAQGPPRPVAPPAPAARPTLVSALPAQLPHDSASLVGRTDETRRIIGLADPDADASPRIVMVVGVGGVGKTTLAVRCGHLLRGRRRCSTCRDPRPRTFSGGSAHSTSWSASATGSRCTT
ncbi:MAG TPA: BTAD domain-containing putative transcriptional regulator [Actinocrinis sp.]